MEYINYYLRSLAIIKHLNHPTTKADRVEEYCSCKAKNADMEIHHHHHHHPLLLYLLALLACSLACTENINRTDFPAGFMFGAGSSAYQVYIYTSNCTYNILTCIYICMLHIYYVWGFYSFWSTKGLHTKMEKGPAYGILSLGYIQVPQYSLSLF